MLAKEWADSMVYVPDAAVEVATTELPLIHGEVDNEEVVDSVRQDKDYVALIPCMVSISEGLVGPDDRGVAIHCLREEFHLQ
jgi:hypothetical protein